MSTMAKKEVVPTRMEVRERILKGIEFLDKELGKGWVWEIDLERLDLEQVCDCVLGQLAVDVYPDYPWPSYTSWLRNRIAYHKNPEDDPGKITGDEAVAYGFNSRCIWDPNEEIEMAWLTEQWTYEIKRLRWQRRASRPKNLAQ